MENQVFIDLHNTTQSFLLAGVLRALLEQLRRMFCVVWREKNAGWKGGLKEFWKDSCTLSLGFITSDTCYCFTGENTEIVWES